jgi:hypothetical protein
MSNHTIRKIKRTCRPRNACLPLPPRVHDTLGDMTVQQADAIARLICNGLFPMLNKVTTEYEKMTVPVYSIRRMGYCWIHIRRDGTVSDAE